MKSLKFSVWKNSKKECRAWLCRMLISWFPEGSWSFKGSQSGPQWLQEPNGLRKKRTDARPTLQTTRRILDFYSSSAAPQTDGGHAALPKKQLIQQRLVQQEGPAAGGAGPWVDHLHHLSSKSSAPAHHQTHHSGFPSCTTWHPSRRSRRTHKDSWRLESIYPSADRSIPAPPAPVWVH